MRPHRCAPLKGRRSAPRRTAKQSLKETIQNKISRKWMDIVPWLLLAAAYGITVVSFARYGMHNLDADMSSELLLADLLNREGRLLTDSWYYSSELRTVSPVPLYQLGLLLFESWHSARVFGTALMLAGIIAAFLYFARQANLGRAGVYMAVVLAMPFSDGYAYVAFLNGGYSVYLMLVFVLLGLGVPATALVAHILMWAVGAATLISGVQYLWGNRQYINTAK